MENYVKNRLSKVVPANDLDYIMEAIKLVDRHGDYGNFLMDVKKLFEDAAIHGTVLVLNRIAGNFLKILVNEGVGILFNPNLYNLSLVISMVYRIKYDSDGYIADLDNENRFTNSKMLSDHIGFVTGQKVVFTTVGYNEIVEALHGRLSNPSRYVYKPTIMNQTNLQIFLSGCARVRSSVQHPCLNQFMFNPNILIACSKSKDNILPQLLRVKSHIECLGLIDEEDQLLTGLLDLYISYFVYFGDTIKTTEVLKTVVNNLCGSNHVTSLMARDMLDTVFEKFVGCEGYLIGLRSLVTDEKTEVSSEV